MARSKILRKIHIKFKKVDEPHIFTGRKESVVLTYDEFEAIRLSDLSGFYQKDACKMMGVSRATFARILLSGRKKLALALINKAAIALEKGDVVYEKERLKCPIHSYLKREGKFCLCKKGEGK
jgi:predicted DNA-binding protein (UPF0251 family)